MISYISIILFSVISVSAQGIYKSSYDFMEGKLAYAKQSPGDKHAIRTDLPFKQSVVKVVTANETVHLEKSDVYGYKDKHNRNFRFYNNANYKILDAAAFFIYSREVNVVKGKTKTRETKYYFSADADSPVIDLTISNLKNVFFANREFHDLVDLQFRNDAELARFDPFYNEYKIRSLYEKSLGR
jgi:hypothetical protein